MAVGKIITAEEVGQSPDRIRGRQAVILIHGIGEQQPMSTLRDFISGLYPVRKDGRLLVFSKPDRISEVLDLRRMAASAAVTGNSTDFYELYWAHLLQGTTWSHIQDWIAVLLLRRDVPDRLRWLRHTLLAALFLITVAWILICLTATTQVVLGLPIFLSFMLMLFAPVIRFLGQKVGLGYLGDAARYLRPAPENIGIRQDIRNAGLNVLRRLHDEPMQRYDRIVIVGHSLGSVIAYDILTHLWQEMHGLHSKPFKPEQPNYEKMRRCLEEEGGTPGDVESFRTMQKELLKEEQSLGMPWKITDFITVGSPLTYANFLLADAKYDIEKRKRDRELPTCPPQLEDSRDIGFLSPSYQLQDGTMSIKKLLHHAALFACTRWTNIYFSSDLIAGPVRHLFGNGIKEIEILSHGLRSHVMYWNAHEPQACDALKKGMSLCEVEEGNHD